MYLDNSVLEAAQSVLETIQLMLQCLLLQKIDFF